MSHRLPITIRLDHFEGPLDLLLYLIQSHELDISKIAISRITDQYLGYVRLMQELNFDLASEFLVMAATLVYWKSKSLLPHEKSDSQSGGANADEEATPESLIRQLLEHQRFLEAGQVLGVRPWLGEDVFTRPNKRAPIEKIWKSFNISDLVTSYQDMLVRARKRTQILRKETVSLADKIFEFSDRLEMGKPTDLRNLISALATRPEVVVTFLATLELARLKKLRVFQEGTYQPILVELIDSLRTLDASLLTGFDAQSAIEKADHPEASVAHPAGPDSLPSPSTTSTELNPWSTSREIPATP